MTSKVKNYLDRVLYLITEDDVDLNTLSACELVALMNVKVDEWETFKSLGQQIYRHRGQYVLRLNNTENVSFPTYEQAHCSTSTCVKVHTLV